MQLLVKLVKVIIHMGLPFSFAIEKPPFLIRGPLATRTAPVFLGRGARICMAYLQPFFLPPLAGFIGYGFMPFGIFMSFIARLPYPWRQ